MNNPRQIRIDKELYKLLKKTTKTDNKIETKEFVNNEKNPIIEEEKIVDYGKNTHNSF